MIYAAAYLFQTIREALFQFTELWHLHIADIVSEGVYAK